MTLREALQAARCMTTEEARATAVSSQDAMLRAVCGWRSDVTLHHRFDELLRAARTGPLLGGRSADRILAALRHQPRTRDELMALGLSARKMQRGLQDLRRDHEIAVLGDGRYYWLRTADESAIIPSFQMSLHG